MSIDQAEQALKKAAKAAEEAVAAAAKAEAVVLESRANAVVGQVSYALEGVEEARSTEKAREEAAEQK